MLSPFNKAAGIGSLNDHTFRNVTIDWATLEGATSYQWQCDYNSDFSTVPATFEGTTSGSSVRLPALEPATSYYWRVRVSAPVLSPWSEKWSFTTGLDTEVITLKPESPTAGASEVPTKPAFQWTAINGASNYELLVSANADFDHPAIIRTEKYAVPTNVWQCDVNLDYQTTYYWKVRAVSSGTSSAWSSTSVFTTGPAPVKFAESTPGTPPPPPNPFEKISVSSSAMPGIPTQAASSQLLAKPVQAPPQETSALPPLNPSLELPAWVIYFVLGLLATVFLALLIILAIVLKIRRL